MLVENTGHQEGSPISSRRDRTNIKDRHRDKDLEIETRPGEGVVNEDKFPNSRKYSHGHVCGEFWNLRGQHDEEKEKNNNKHTECTPNCNCQWTSGPDVCVIHKTVRAGQGGVVYIVSP